MLLRCEMCGGEIEVSADQSVGICQYCGSKFTIPKALEKKGNLFNRANYLRQSCNFDDATDVYKSILGEIPEDADALWGIVLCRYGIEFVEDPKTKARIPTCHRASRTSILLDPDYKAALRYADEEKRSVFSENAQKIDKIQKEIRYYSENEEKFDVFICYKESDENGQRTQDSVMAQEIYNELCKAKIKTFFSRKTLEKRLGSEYEPIIYSALNSAKVMVVLGTTPDYFKATWVKNEWSRYLDFMKDDDDKHLIPAYRGMSPYELPEEFASLQALDMSKIGFILDLCDGIKKILNLDGDKNELSMENTVAATKDGLYSRAMICLGNRDFYKAVDYFEKILDIDHQYARAYWGSILASYQCRTNNELCECQSEDWSTDARLAYALQYAEEEERKIYEDTVTKYIENFKKFATNALMNNEFKECEKWCRKYLKHNESDSEAWWVIILSQNESRNSKELFERCTGNLVTISDKQEYLNAVNFSNDETKKNYEETAANIDSAVDSKKTKQAIRECDLFMSQSLMRLKQKKENAIKQQIQNLDKENSFMKYSREHEGRFHQNNVFAFLFFILCWSIGIYAIVTLICWPLDLWTYFGWIFGIAYSAIVFVVLLIDIGKKISAIRNLHTGLSKSTQKHIKREKSLSAENRIIQELTENEVQATTLYEKFENEENLDLNTVEYYHSQFETLMSKIGGV